MSLISAIVILLSNLFHDRYYTVILATNVLRRRPTRKIYQRTKLTKSYSTVSSRKSKKGNGMVTIGTTSMYRHTRFITVRLPSALPHLKPLCTRYTSSSRTQLFTHPQASACSLNTPSCPMPFTRAGFSRSMYTTYGV